MTMPPQVASSNPMRLGHQILERNIHLCFFDLPYPHTKQHLKKQIIITYLLSESCQNSIPQFIDPFKYLRILLAAFMRVTLGSLMYLLTNPNVKPISGRLLHKDLKIPQFA